jgi:hypothetical protein
LAAIAVATGFTVVWKPDLFLGVLAADLWILGYHHVIATYTRLAFDRESFLEQKALLLYALPAVAGVVLILVVAFDPWLVPTIYLYWQWWHYTRQSEGISKAYLAKNRNKCNDRNPWLTRAAFYSVPVTGILAVSNRAPGQFLFFPLKTLPVADLVVDAAFGATAILLSAWLISQVRAWIAGKFAVSYVLYILSHHLIYFLAYIYIEEINYGWLTINIWHNAQYIMFVWMYNNRRFGGQVDPESRFLSTISQNGRILLYLATCLTISTAIYFVISSYLATALSTAFAMTTTAIALIIYQTINFHHYIVDSMIWKLRKSKLRTNLQLT